MNTRPPPHLGRTTRTTMAVAGMTGAGLSWLLVQSLEYLGQAIPRVPLMAPLLVMAVAVGVGVLAWWAHQQIQVKRRRVVSEVGLTWLVIGKTALLAGIGLAGAYGSLAAQFVSSLAAPLGGERVLHSGLAAGAGAVLAVAGWFLERACVVPHDPPGETRATPLGDPGSPVPEG
jgi:hypothetical protein